MVSQEQFSNNSVLMRIFFVLLKRINIGEKVLTSLRSGMCFLILEPSLFWNGILINFHFILSLSSANRLRRALSVFFT